MFLGFCNSITIRRPHHKGEASRPPNSEHREQLKSVSCLSVCAHMLCPSALCGSNSFHADPQDSDVLMPILSFQLVPGELPPADASAQQPPRRTKRKLPQVRQPKRRPKTPPRCKCQPGATRCRASELEQEPYVTHVRVWREEWKRLTLKDRRDSLLAYFRELKPCGGQDTDAVPSSIMLRSADGRQAFAKKGRLAHQFLGLPCCYHGFLRHTRVTMWKARTQYARAETTYTHPGFKRHRPRTEEMESALLMLVELLRNSSPFKNTDPEAIPLPFSEKKVLWKMLLHRYEAARGSSPAGPSMAILFSKRPRLKTFYHVLRTCQALKKVRFHRVVAIGRCAKCCFLRWKCLSAIAPAERARWQDLAAKHQALQLAQKHTYATDRARAALDYPNTEIYMAFDGGSGYEFWLPHFSAKSAEAEQNMIIITALEKILPGNNDEKHRKAKKNPTNIANNKRTIANNLGKTYYYLMLPTDSFPR